MWLSLAACALLVWIVSGFLLRAAHGDEVFDRTSVAGVAVGGQTRDQAAELIAAIEPQKIQLSGPRRSYSVRAPQAGLVVDAEASAERAYSSGRSGIVAVLSGPLGVFRDAELEPVYEPVDSKRLARTVERIAARADRDPFVGALSVDRQTLEVATQQPEAGVRVQRSQAREELLAAFNSGRVSIELPVERQPAPSPSEVREVARQAELYLRRPLRIRTLGNPASFKPRQLARVLAIEPSDDGIRLGAEAEEVEPLVSRFAARRDRPARDAGLDTPSQPPVTLSEQGDLSWRPKPNVASVKRARDGRRIRQRRAVEATVEAVRRNEHRVRFATARVEPSVTTEVTRSATSLLGTFTTSYSCCEPRVTNIQRMAATVDGTVIGPGEQFSLNGIAGERTRANGYKPAPTIGEGNKLIETVGGGVSQFSTTTYNAAYFAGLQIDAHTPHSFYISRYPPGRESTLNFGSIDLLWTNDTKAPVTVRASASDTSVTVSIFGGNGGRRVRAVTQSRSDNGKGGFDITVDRVIRYGDGSRAREPYTTSYGVPAG